MPGDCRKIQEHLHTKSVRSLFAEELSRRTCDISGANPNQISTTSRSCTKRPLFRYNKGCWLTDSDLHPQELFAPVQEAVAVSALLNKCAAGNSLQEIEPAFGLSSVFAVGFGKGWENRRLLQTNYRPPSQYWFHIMRETKQSNMTALSSFLAD